MIQTGAAFSVRFLRNGDQITIVRDVIDDQGNGTPLFQVIDPTTGAVAPDWSNLHPENQPIIQLGARAASGAGVRITNVNWYYNGTQLVFAYDGSEWVPAADGNMPFKANIVNGKYRLRIVGNLASMQALSNKQISYEVEYISNGKSDTVRGQVDVLIQASGSDSHILQITTNRVELDENHTSATLTAVGYYGTTPISIGQNGYTIEWYKDGSTLIQGQTGATLVVTRDMITGSSLFVAKLKLNNSLVAQDSQRISDIADEYQVGYIPRSAAESACSYDGTDHNAVWLLSILRNGILIDGWHRVNEQNVYTDGGASYAWQAYNTFGEGKTSGEGSTVTVTPADCLLSGTLHSDDAVYGDADVQVTATL